MMALGLTGFAQSSSSSTTPPKPDEAAAPALQQREAPAVQPGTSAENPSNTRQITEPAGTEVLLKLQNVIDTKSARAGDGVYCQTTFPVVIDNVMIIPPGSYVKGEITRV